MKAQVSYVNAQGCILSLQGALDEGFDSEVLAQATSGVLVLDLDQVPRSNSAGVALWMKALSHPAAAYVGLLRVRPALLYNFNLVRGFQGRGELVSFYAPYVCQGCGAELLALFDLTAPKAMPSSPPTPNRISCSKCRGAAELDDIPEVYFEFVKKHPAHPPPELFGLLGTRVPRGVPFWR